MDPVGATLHWIAGVGGVLAALGALTWDIVSRASAIQAGLALLAGGAVAGGLAMRLQRTLVARLLAEPSARVSLWRLEWRASLPGVLLVPFVIVAVAVRALVRRLLRRPAPPPSHAPATGACVVATLGPSYLIAALLVSALYLAGRLGELLLASRYGLTPGAPAWQFVLWGRRPELGAALPLEQFPYAAALVTGMFWLAVWGLCGRLVRGVLGHELGRNLARDRDQPRVLSSWRGLFAAETLVAPHDSYRRWAAVLLVLAVPLLLWGWLSLDATPYRLTPSEFAVPWTLWLAWVLHLTLRGAEHGTERRAEPRPPRVEGHGWVDVLADLEGQLQIGEPLPIAPLRPVERHVPATRDWRREGLISPLLDELLGKTPLSWMQYEELRHLAALGHVHLPPPVPAAELSLPQATDRRDRAGMERRRNRIVLAPEGSGRSTLALLAACNHALVHTRAALVVVRSEGQARELDARLRGWVEPSALRWNLRVRRADSDLVSDLAQGVLPDVVVCDLQSLVVPLLDEPERYAPFLRNVGLIVVDDAEAFAGPVEVHAQLAFRRLKLLLRELQHVAELGEEQAPLFFVLAAESMHGMRQWICDLCGIKAGVHSYGHDAAELRVREAASRASAELREAARAGGERARPAAGVAETGAPASDDEQGDTRSSRHHVLYRLVDFKNPQGRPLLLPELLASCERLAVPWHYRRCGDHQRHFGLTALALAEEPRHHCGSPAEACVVVLEGPLSAVRREARRLRHAGARFVRSRDDATVAPAEEAAEPIAFVLVGDRDEDTALTQRDAHAGLAQEIERLPLPILRPPAGPAVLAHFATDLSRRWVEVGDLVETYGGGVARCLRELARDDLLLAEPSVDLQPLTSAYETRLRVRARARAFAERGPAGAALPARIADVRLASARRVRVVDRTTLNVLMLADADSVDARFYPGRIVSTELGRFVVVDPEARDDDAGPLDGGTLWVEPVRGDDVSSPRRRVSISEADSAADPWATAAGAPFFGPDRLQLGPSALGVALRPVRVSCEHVATLRVDPLSGAVRQRQLYGPQRTASAPRPSLYTEALWLYPLAPAGAGTGEPAGPALSLAAARLIAAAMRLVLPSLYRGGEDDLDVALLTRRVPWSAEGAEVPVFVLFDVQSGGNGAARALARDGLELLLRLVRLVVERVLVQARLLALHDHWPESITPETDAEHAAEDDARRRRAALEWLDAHLRPEVPPDAEGPTGEPAGASEPGEGDIHDLGRCWYSRDGSLRDLVWVKHAWRTRGTRARRVMLDIGFDRPTAEESRVFTEHSRVLESAYRRYQVHLETPAMRLPDGRVWGAPRPVWLTAASDDKPRPSCGDPAADASLREYHALVCAVAAHTLPALGPLAEKLHAEAGRAGVQGRLDLARYVSAFVQDIPYSIPLALRRGLRPPLSTLLYRRGDCDSKSVLLALLFKHCGIDSGLLVSFTDSHAVAAVAVPDPLEGIRDDSAEAALQIQRRLGEWCSDVGLGEPPRVWATLPEGPGASAPRTLVYLAVESTARHEIGRTSFEHPESWSFLPLVAIGGRYSLDNTPAAHDSAEMEGL